MGRVKAELIDGFYVVGELGYLPDEWHRLERERARRREQRAAYHRAYREANRERIREINREHMRRKRAGEASRPAVSPEERRARKLHRSRKWAVGGEYRALQVTASLHGLACTGPTKVTGCRCDKTLIVRDVTEAAA
jgi:hypothetical protein